MKTILDRYNEIKDLPGITGGIDKLIIECFRYKVFKENPSERFKKDFEDRYDYPYPEYVSDITRKLARNLRIRTKYCRTQAMLALKKSQQRANRGFSDFDVWSIDVWFLEVMPQMLKSFKKHQDGYPSRFLQSTNPTDEEEKAASEKWNGILDRMIYLLNEMDEDKCSMKNPYEKEKHRIDAQFRRKYGLFGENAKSPSELEKKEVTGGRRMYFPSDFPDLYPTYDELYEKWSDSYDEICEYRDKCRKEFFELFSEYFWDLWY